MPNSSNLGDVSSKNGAIYGKKLSVTKHTWQSLWIRWQIFRQIILKNCHGRKARSWKSISYIFSGHILTGNWMFRVTLFGQRSRFAISFFSFLWTMHFFPKCVPLDRKIYEWILLLLEYMYKKRVIYLKDRDTLDLFISDRPRRHSIIRQDISISAFFHDFVEAIFTRDRDEIEIYDASTFHYQKKKKNVFDRILLAQKLRISLSYTHIRSRIGETYRDTKKRTKKKRKKKKNNSKRKKSRSPGEDNNFTSNRLRNPWK